MQSNKLAAIKGITKQSIFIPSQGLIAYLCWMEGGGLGPGRASAVYLLRPGLISILL